MDLGFVQAVIFDVDGTLVTDELHWHKHLHMLRHWPEISPTEDEWHQISGLSDRDAYKFISEKAQKFRPDIFLPSEDAYISGADTYFYGHLNQIKLRVGAKDLLDAAGTHYRPKGIATNGNRKETNLKLLFTEIRDCFHPDIVTCVDDVQRPKPDPEIYLECFRKAKMILGDTLVHPSQMLAIEDTAKGATAALLAGYTVVLWQHEARTVLMPSHPNLTIIENRNIDRINQALMQSTPQIS